MKLAGRLIEEGATIALTQIYRAERTVVPAAAASSRIPGGGTRLPGDSRSGDAAISVGQAAVLSGKVRDLLVELRVPLRPLEARRLVDPFEFRAHVALNLVELDLVPAGRPPLGHPQFGPTPRQTPAILGGGYVTGAVLFPVS